MSMERRVLGFHATIIPFYLVLYYSTVPARGQRPPFVLCDITSFFIIHLLFLAFLSIFFGVSPTVPTATILGGPDLHVDKGSTINLTCTVKFSPEPPAYIFWYHHEEVITVYSYIPVLEKCHLKLAHLKY